MAGLTGDQIFEKYRRKMAAAGPDIIAGINASTKSQSGNAIKAKTKMETNLLKALSEGKWEAGLKKSGDAKWERNLKEKGIPKITAGIDANAQEIKDTFAKVAAVGQAISAQIQTMPNETLEDSIQRMVANVHGMRAAWGK